MLAFLKLDVPRRRMLASSLTHSHQKANTREPTAVDISAASAEISAAKGSVRCQRFANNVDSYWNSSCNTDTVRSRPSIPDSQLIILCRWCIAGGDFIPMSAYKDGRFVCTWCAHTVRPGVSQYRCKCRVCGQFREVVESGDLAGNIPNCLS